jgi:hypothetical protein
LSSCRRVDGAQGGDSDGEHDDRTEGDRGEDAVRRVRAQPKRAGHESATRGASAPARPAEKIAQRDARESEPCGVREAHGTSGTTEADA